MFSLQYIQMPQGRGVSSIVEYVSRIDAAQQYITQNSVINTGTGTYNAVPRFETNGKNIQNSEEILKEK